MIVHTSSVIYEHVVMAAKRPSGSGSMKIKSFSSETYREEISDEESQKVHHVSKQMLSIV